jgi:hypothetical protein
LCPRFADELHLVGSLSRRLYRDRTGVRHRIRSAGTGIGITDICRGWWAYEIDNLTCPISIHSVRSTVHFLVQAALNYGDIHIKRKSKLLFFLYIWLQTLGTFCGHEILTADPSHRVVRNSDDVRSWFLILVR